MTDKTILEFKKKANQQQDSQDLLYFKCKTHGTLSELETFDLPTNQPPLAKSVFCPYCISVIFKEAQMQLIETLNHEIGNQNDR
jgi:hypothetical protein